MEVPCKSCACYYPTKPTFQPEHFKNKIEIAYFIFVEVNLMKEINESGLE